ncbi:MAG: DUF2905 family protein [Sphaerobacter sp.]|nr:DUF2905 family protein [Sphaerobacter sp.]
MSDLSQLGKVILGLGLILVLLGGILFLVGRVPLLGRLPGDLTFRRGPVTVYIPLATMLLLSLLLTIILNILFRLFRR